MSYNPPEANPGILTGQGSGQRFHGSSQYYQVGSPGHIAGDDGGCCEPVVAENVRSKVAGRSRSEPSRLLRGSCVDGCNILCFIPDFSFGNDLHADT
eukprot:902433-Prorocentrum_minimum.AAC.3